MLILAPRKPRDSSVWFITASAESASRAERSSVRLSRLLLLAAAGCAGVSLGRTPLGPRYMHTGEFLLTVVFFTFFCKLLYRSCESAFTPHWEKHVQIFSDFYIVASLVLAVAGRIVKFTSRVVSSSGRMFCDTRCCRDYDYVLCCVGMFLIDSLEICFDRCFVISRCFWQAISGFTELV